IRVQNITTPPPPLAANAPGGGYIQVTATLPTGFTYVSSIPGSSGFDCSPSSGTSLVCRYSAVNTPLPANYDDNFTVTVGITRPALVSGNFPVSVTQAANGEENAFDNTYTQNYTVITKPDLIISRFF